MKFIRNGVILTTNNSLVVEQMKKYGYQEYIEDKEETVKEPETPKEETTKTSKKKKK